MIVAEFHVGSNVRFYRITLYYSTHIIELFLNTIQKLKFDLMKLKFCVLKATYTLKTNKGMFDEKNSSRTSRRSFKHESFLKNLRWNCAGTLKIINGPIRNSFIRTMFLKHLKYKLKLLKYARNTKRCLRPPENDL